MIVRLLSKPFMSHMIRYYSARKPSQSLAKSNSSHPSGSWSESNSPFCAISCPQSISSRSVSQLSLESVNLCLFALLLGDTFLLPLSFLFLRTLHFRLNGLSCFEIVFVFTAFLGTRPDGILVVLSVIRIVGMRTLITVLRIRLFILVVCVKLLLGTTTHKLPIIPFTPAATFKTIYVMLNNAASRAVFVACFVILMAAHAMMTDRRVFVCNIGHRGRLLQQ